MLQTTIPFRANSDLADKITGLASELKTTEAWVLRYLVRLGLDNLDLKDAQRSAEISATHNRRSK